MVDVEDGNKTCRKKSAFNGELKTCPARKLCGVHLVKAKEKFHRLF